MCIGSFYYKCLYFISVKLYTPSSLVLYSGVRQQPVWLLERCSPCTLWGMWCIMLNSNHWLVWRYDNCDIDVILPPGSSMVRSLTLVGLCLGLFSEQYPRSFIPYFILLHYRDSGFCFLLLHSVSVLLFPWARYIHCLGYTPRAWEPRSNSTCWVVYCVLLATARVVLRLLWAPY